MAEAKTQKFNRGDAAEGILGAALAAKFAKRPKAIGQAFPKLTIKDIDDMLDDFFSTGRRVNTRVGDIVVSKGKSKVRDNIVLGIGLPDAAMKLLKKKANRKVVYDLYESAISYVEDTWLKEVEIYAINANPDEIEILSDGVGDQKGTKADIKININGKPYKRQISLKVGGGDQFAQVSGHEFSKQAKIWNDMLGLNISNLEKKYNDAIKNYNSTLCFSSRDDKKLMGLKQMVKDAAGIVYKEASRQIGEKIRSKDTKFFTNFSNMVFFGATRGDESIELVKLETSVKRLRFDRNFVKRYTETLKKSNMKVSFREVGDPLVQIHSGGVGKSNLVLQIRVKVEAASKSTKQGKMYSPYMRNYVEAGPKMFSIGM
jgi:hypothetical protein